MTPTTLWLHLLITHLATLSELILFLAVSDDWCAAGENPTALAAAAISSLELNLSTVPLELLPLQLEQGQSFTNVRNGYYGEV